MNREYRPEHSPALENRYERTMRFLVESAPPPRRILDLGARNPLSARMEEAGYVVFNTDGDLDVSFDSLLDRDADIVTAFEILEHLVAPFNVLRNLPCRRLVATVPLRLWFASAYRSRSDAWDRHFHEFEDWQFDWLLEKAGWKVVRRQKWKSPSSKVGFRPLLRLFTYRYYAVEAVRED